MKLADGKITISKEGLRILEEEIKKLSEEQLG
jgi:hypothetical protein